jgi:hypothetical protein
MQCRFPGGNIYAEELPEGVPSSRVFSSAFVKPFCPGEEFLQVIIQS